MAAYLYTSSFLSPISSTIKIPTLASIWCAWTVYYVSLTEREEEYGEDGGWTKVGGGARTQPEFREWLRQVTGWAEEWIIGPISSALKLFSSDQVSLLRNIVWEQVFLKTRLNYGLKMSYQIICILLNSYLIPYKAQ